MKGLIKMIGSFIGGIFVGGFIGIVTMCILSVAGNNDYEYDDTHIKEKHHNDESNDV